MKSTPYLTFESGGYRRLKSFILSRICYDVTVRFAELYIPFNSRTKDQMVQAARSGVQNIAEGSVTSATSKSGEIRLTGVAKASLEELRLDYEDYLRQHGLPLWQQNNPLRVECIRRRIESNREFHAFIDWAMANFPQECKDAVVANAALLLIKLASFFTWQTAGKAFCRFYRTWRVS